MDTNMVQLGLPGAGSSVPDTVLPKASGADAAPIPKKEAAGAPLGKAKNAGQEQISFDAKQSEVVRAENMRKATQMMFKDIYAVRDNKFAIYKDATGQFVTRFTNLRDGTVSYIP